MLWNPSIFLTFVLESYRPITLRSWSWCGRRELSLFSAPTKHMNVTLVYNVLIVDLTTVCILGIVHDIVLSKTSSTWLTPILSALVLLAGSLITGAVRVVML